MSKRASAIAALVLTSLLMPIWANGQRSRSFDERYNERYEVNEKGDSSFTLVPQAFVEPASVTAENSERIALSARQILRMQKVNGLKKAAFQRSAADAIDTSLPVAGIPIVSGISPTGARTYSIPIATAPGYGLTPQISLQYNSQGSNGIAGYGWSIGGLSSITVSGKSPYYDGGWAAPDPSSSDAVWSLDGVRLVKNVDSYTSAYQFETVSGNIKVMKHLASNDAVSYFTAIYPDGRKVKYGWETNTSAKRCYPVTEIEDVTGNLITFNYESLSYTGNVYVISKIDYGHRRVSGTVTTPKESIYFFYENRTDCIEMYYAGELVCCKKLLTRVSSPGILHEYNLSHNLSDGVNLLSSVECKVADQVINPLRFHYGGEGTGQTVVHIEDGSFRQTGDGYLMSYFNDSITTVKNRGKLVPNSYDDGLIIHPYFSPYKVVYWDKKWYETKRSYKYGSGYPEDQVILVAPRVEDGVFDVDRTLTTGTGFQTIEAVDVNGDGIEELVKINFGEVKDDKTTLTPYGSPMIVNDAKGRSTYYSYDCFGNVTRKRYPDLSEETVETEWGGEGLYTVTKSVTQQPVSKIHYNATGREVRSEVQRFDGTWLVTDTEYRADGLVDKVSLPFKGDSASGWAVYDYDAYKRTIKIEEASGKVSTWAYSGLSMTTTGEGIPSTKTSDQSGRVCIIQDPGGEITYSYRPDGQLEQVVAPESVLTSFEYDSYGRRIKIIDPSAGVRSTSYVNNNDGSSVVTETNPNGSVVTYLDAYGRKTKVERPGEYNTVYTYSDDNLLMSEVSTNGTSTVYAYDKLDRVSSVKTTVPDGKWLLKEYTYGGGSVVNAVKYSSQDGEIATEVYSYSNGYNVQIAIAAGTVIWRLVEENNFGQPTRALTGNVDRFYSFDAHGLPTGRALGTVQEFAYDFDPVTGNLNERFDAVNSAGEVFGYDDLNRLDTVVPNAYGDLSQYSVSYRPDGNISEKEGIGVFSYENNARPYQLTKIDLESGVDVPRVPQSISYTCYSRPSRISENGVSCSFTYDGDGNRAKMLIANGATPILSRYYIGGQYELDAKADGTVQRLYLGGDAYSAPMVYVKDGSSPWLLYNIGRDYLGSVTCIASVDGALVAEYSYDPWGRLRNPETLELYASGEEPELFLGRGFTGHEHLPYFGLINMNARLYDPFTGRFLSPDPYVQAPDFTQNYNRYSYALNNPLKYGDPNGEFVITTTTILIAGAILASAAYGGYKAYTIADKGGYKGWDMVLRVAAGCAVGAISCAASIYTGGAVAGALGTLGGFWGGAIAGAAGGAVGGAMSGAGMTAIAGGDGEAMLKNAGIGALSGAATGALVGGVTNGCIALKNKQTFWTGSPKVPAPSQAIRPPLKDDGPKIKPVELKSPEPLADLPASRSSNIISPQHTLRMPPVEQLSHSGMTFSDSAINDAVRYATSPNNLNHYFHGNLHNHNFGDLLQAFGGSERELVRTAIQGANGAYSVSTEGLFSANVNIYNQTVTITGRVVNGIPKVGTMYIVR